MVNVTPLVPVILKSAPAREGDGALGSATDSLPKVYRYDMGCIPIDKTIMVSSWADGAALVIEHKLLQGKIKRESEKNV